MASLIEQLQAFAVTVLGGLLMGLLFDLLRAARSGLRRGSPLGMALDLVYWIVLTPIMAALLLEANWGQLRLYVLVGIGTGLALYFAFLSWFVLETVIAFVHAAVALTGWVVHAVVAIAALPAAFARSVTLGRGGGSRGRRQASPGRPAGGFFWRPGLAWRRR
ncbi:MAG: hypothetical protein H0Z37_03005 [Firmicutes bacterium]|nr:hypothetical protein [Bacillota bacterium]